MKNAIYGWTAAVPSIIDIPKLQNVLDVAAGTCVWTADFANMPEVNARLALPGRAPVTSPIHLFATDIDTKFFPDKEFLDSFGIETFQHDVTKPFPPDMHGKFDLIHISFLLLCITEQGWKDALENCRQALSMCNIL